MSSHNSSNSMSDDSDNQKIKRNDNQAELTTGTTKPNLKQLMRSRTWQEQKQTNHVENSKLENTMVTSNSTGTQQQKILDNINETQNNKESTH